MRQTFIILSILILSMVPVYGYFAHNETCIAFNDCSGEGENADSKISVTPTETINDLVVSSAGHYLKAQSTFYSFLHGIETNSKNEDVKKALSDTIREMEQAKASYYSLLLLSFQKNYDYSVISRLFNFDYNSLEAQNAFNPVVFREVKARLENGDVRGCYYWTYKEVCEIVNELKAVSVAIEAGEFPNLKEIRKLNQRISNVQFFGQYTTEVFNEILE